DLQGQRLRLRAAYVQRRDRERARVQRFERDAELRGADGLAIADLHTAGIRSAEHLEILFQWRQVRRAERATRLDVERNRFAQAHVAAIEECVHACGLRQRRQQHQQDNPPSTRHCCGSSCCCPLRCSHSSRNFRRSSAPGSSGTACNIARCCASKRPSCFSSPCPSAKAFVAACFPERGAPRACCISRASACSACCVCCSCLAASVADALS